MAQGDPRRPRLRAVGGGLNQVNLRVRERRDALRITRDTLSARVATVTGGLWIPDRQDILKIEHATRTVTDVEMLALAKALECDAAWLFLGTTPTQKPEQNQATSTDTTKKP